ncbi:hypothetical protein AH4AK4_4016 [Aeromonas hydrophila 4AK4]|nr:hypothetical protein AH4AK4_4016 [Aeromonas hydrophila 4AK4]
MLAPAPVRRSIMWCSTGHPTARLPETTGQKAAIATSEEQ